jgi:hypothetical protein
MLPVERRTGLASSHVQKYIATFTSGYHIDLSCNMMTVAGLVGNPNNPSVHLRRRLLSNNLISHAGQRLVNDVHLSKQLE